MAGNAPWRFSVQQITSCTANGFGCGGGDTIEAYEQVGREGGMEGGRALVLCFVIQSFI